MVTITYQLSKVETTTYPRGTRRENRSRSIRKIYLVQVSENGAMRRDHSLVAHKWNSSRYWTLIDTKTGTRDFIPTEGQVRETMNRWLLHRSGRQKLYTRMLSNQYRHRAYERSRIDSNDPLAEWERVLLSDLFHAARTNSAVVDNPF